MKILFPFALTVSLLSAQSGYAENLWDSTQATACNYNPSLGGSVKCTPKNHLLEYTSPLESFETRIPPFFNYDLTLAFTFTCKREVGTLPLSAEISIIDLKTKMELSRLRLSPTSSAEKRKLSFKVKSDRVQASLNINPSLTSTYYGPCYFEMHEPQFVPDFENLEWYADNLIDQQQFVGKVDQALADALSKPNGWERAEQLAADLNGYSETKLSECKRNIRQLARKLRIEPSARTPDDQYLITELSGFDSASLTMTPEDLSDSEGICNNKSALAFSGKIGTFITDIMNLRDAEEKAKVFLSLEDCRNQASEICRTKVQGFRSGVLNQFKTALQSKEKNFLDYLDMESNRLRANQRELSEQLRGLFNEINLP